MTILRVYRNNYIPHWDAECEFVHLQRFCSLLRETIQVWLLPFYLPNFKGKEGIDGTKQFESSTFHTLVVVHGVF